MESEKKDVLVEFDLDFRYEGSEYPSLRAVEGTVEQGKCIVLCGSSGCGKTTLLRCINQLIPQFYEGTLRGFCRINSRDTSEMSIGEVGKSASSVFQDPRSQFFTLNSSNEVAFGLENFGYSREEMVLRTEAVFKNSSLEFLKNKNVFELSSGERQLVAILAAQAVDTEIYLLDEPTANLDFFAIKRFAEQLKSIKNRGKTLIISEHRLYYLKDLADEYWLMENGEIKQKISAAEMQAYSDKERAALKLRATNPDHVHPEDPIELPKESKHVFEARNICYSYQGTKNPVLENMNFTGKTGEVVALVGANGCGKTTFGKLCGGLYKQKSGSFSLDSRILRKKELTNQAIFIMQEAEFQFFTNSVWNELCYGQQKTEEFTRQAEELLRAMDLWKYRNQHPFSLSGGQMQRLVLILAYLSKKPVAILDEPTAGLDYQSLLCCVRLIQEMQKTKLVLIITHDLELIAKACTRALCIKNKKAEREYILESKERFEELKDEMQKENPPAAPVGCFKEKKSVRMRLNPDPRTKLLVFFVAMMAGIGTDIPLILSSFTAVLAVLLADRQWKALYSSVILMGMMFLSYEMIPCVITAFLISFFPRVLLIFSAAVPLISKEQAPKTLAALRKLHIPEKAIMVCAVTFRFFPVLKKDMGMMRESMKTRGFFKTFKEKIKALPEWFEIMIVPMVFRVIRIADALSASAETRGISLKNKRESYIEIKMRMTDIVLVVLTVILTAIGLIVNF